MFSSVHTIVRNYYVYVRLLRQADDLRKDEALDMAHATFYVEIKILSFFPKLIDSTEALEKIASKLANIRAHNNSDDQKKASLRGCYEEFNIQLPLLLSKI